MNTMQDHLQPLLKTCTQNLSKSFINSIEVEYERRKMPFKNFSKSQSDKGWIQVMSELKNFPSKFQLECRFGQGLEMLETSAN